MLAAAVAFTIPERRPLVATTAFALFVVTGWARGSIFQNADGMTIRSAWWLVTLGIGILMFLIGKPRVPGALLTLDTRRQPHKPVRRSLRSFPSWKPAAG
jgi:hypothetical protein